ncbi:hypothetical protein J3F83DRAFT_551347 [Trichoderma novae-zelandiae]
MSDLGCLAWPCCCAPLAFELRWCNGVSSRGGADGRGQTSTGFAILEQQVCVYHREADTSTLQHRIEWPGNAVGDFNRQQMLGDGDAWEGAAAATLLDAFDHPPRNASSLASRRWTARTAALPLRQANCSATHPLRPSLWVEPFSLLSGSTRAVPGRCLMGPAQLISLDLQSSLARIIVAAPRGTAALGPPVQLSRLCVL